MPVGVGCSEVQPARVPLFQLADQSMVVRYTERRCALDTAPQEWLLPAGVRINSGTWIVTGALESQLMTCRAPCEPIYPTSMAEFQPSSRWNVKFHLWTIGLRKFGSDRAEADVGRKRKHVRGPALREGSQERIQRPLIRKIEILRLIERHALAAIWIPPWFSSPP